MKLIRRILLGAFAISISGCMGTLPIVGLDKNGKRIEERIRRDKFVTKMAQSATDLQESVIPVMDSEDAQKMMNLREVTLGLGLKGSAGLGDYFKLAGNIGFRFVFANK